jgi:flagellum-specific peptidoglycan hydrolase FlgJ
MVILIGSVGQNGKNKMGEVKKVQLLLNGNLYLIPNIKKLSEDDKLGNLTVQAIKEYQKNVLKMITPDGRVDPNGKTLRSLNSNTRKPRPANVKAFIIKTLQSAKSVKLKYGIPVSIIIAQAALESGWGGHVKDNAYFGIKAHNTSATTTSFKTTEFVNGKKVSISDAFRAYKNFEEAAQDYGKFLTANARYKAAFTYKNNPEKFADQLQTAGYATDPLYAKKLKSIISTYYLNEYDN